MPTTAASNAVGLSRAEYGHTPVRQYSPETYDGGDQIFDVVRSANGALFFADPDESRVHRFDGTRWTSIQLPRSPLGLAAGPDGRVWVGCGGDLGYIEEVTGRLEYHSLARFLGPDHAARDRFTDVVVSSDGPVFAGDELMVFSGEEFWIIESPDGGRFSLLTSDRGRLFAVGDRGLYELVGFEPVLIYESGSDWIEGVAILDSGNLLLAVRGAQSSLVDVGVDSESVFSQEAEQILKRASVGPLRRLVSSDEGSRYAVGTVGQGILVLDEEGRLIENVDTSSGLGSNEIYSLLEDPSGTLWAASERGISAVHLSSATTAFSPREGLPFSVNGIERIGEELYATALSGLYRLSLNQAAGASFVPVPGFRDTDTWDIAEIDGTSFAINDDGVFEVSDKRQVYHAGPLGFVDLERTDLVMLVGNRRLEVANQSERPWQRLYRYDLPGYGASGLVEKEGVVWILSAEPVLFRATFDAGYEQPPEVERFEPDLDWYGIDVIGGELTLWGEAGVFGLREGEDSSSMASWRPDSRFSEIDWQHATRDPIFVQVLEDLRGGLWLGERQALTRYRLENGVYAVDPSVGLNADKIVGVFLDPNDPDAIWVTTPDALLRHPFGETSLRGRKQLVTRPILRRVSPGAEAEVVREDHSVTDVAQLATGAYTLRFEYALPAFEIADFVEFRTQVVGLEEAWSEWTFEAQRDLMNIPPGSYDFRVQARHLGQALGESGYSFRILPPWYLTTRWKLLYALAAAVLLLGIVLLQRRQSKRKELRLEHDIEVLQELVAQRTKGLEGLSRRLESMAVTDPLTGLANRRFLNEVLPSDLAQAQRDHDPLDAEGNCLLLLILDLDHFKQINDRYGHAGGDAVLREAAGLLNATLRRSDYVTRIGGEEFAIVVRSAERHNAGATAARIIEAFRSHDFSRCVDGPLRVTCSVGFVAYPLEVDHDPGDIELVMAIADACLYRAKNGGRDGWVGSIETRRLPELTMGPDGLETMVEEGDLELLRSDVDEGLPVEVVS